ncbi:MAG TPA: hypothetical protein PLQ13_12090 [Candidatus Krumholzibacteria bacterium]|nr:hypothetical protein [Candidatus Krumholzibacteria bacterium]
MRRLPLALVTVAVLPLLALLPPGCGSDDNGAGPDTGACGIEIYTPAEGAQFYSNEDVNIRWHASGGGNVMIELLKAGAVVDTIAASTPNDGYAWWAADTRGQTSGSDFALRVASTSSAGCADTVGIDLINTVGCALQLTCDPDTVLQEGQSYEITWIGENTGERVNLELWKGTLEEVWVGDIAYDLSDNGSYVWQNVDSFNQGTADDYYIRIVSNVVDGCADMVGRYSILDDNICYIDVLQPAEDQVYNEGDTMTITFDGNITASTVYIRLYAGAQFVAGGYIADDVVAAGGSFAWTVSKFGFTGPSNVFRVVVFDTDDEYCHGQSGTFTIN